MFFLQLLAVIGSLQPFNSGNATNSINVGKISARHLASIKFIVLRQPTSSSGHQALHAASYSNSELNTPAVQLAHIKFPGLSVASTLLAEINAVVSTNKGEFYVLHVGHYFTALAAYLFGNYSAADKWTRIKILTAAL